MARARCRGRIVILGMFAKAKVYLNLTCYACKVFLFIRDHHDPDVQ